MYTATDAPIGAPPFTSVVVVRDSPSSGTDRNTHVPLDELVEVLAPIANGTSEPHKRQRGSTLVAPKHERAWFQVKELGGLLSGKERDRRRMRVYVGLHTKMFQKEGRQVLFASGYESKATERVHGSLQPRTGLRNQSCET